MDDLGIIVDGFLFSFSLAPFENLDKHDIKPNTLLANEENYGRKTKSMY